MRRFTSSEDIDILAEEELDMWISLERSEKILRFLLRFFVNIAGLTSYAIHALYVHLNVALDYAFSNLIKCSSYFKHIETYEWCSDDQFQVDVMIS